MNTRFCNPKFLPACVLFCLLLAGGLNAQGFLRYYPYSTWPERGTQFVFPQADGSFRITATQFPDLGTDVSLFWWDVNGQGQITGGDTITLFDPTFSTYYLFENGDYLRASTDSTTLLLRRFTASNNLVWSSSLNFPNFQQLFVSALRPNDAGDIFLKGASAGIDSGFVVKFASNGNMLWQSLYSSESTFLVPRHLEPTPDGGCVFVAYSHDIPNNTVETLVRYGADGTLLWNYVPTGYLYPYNSKRSVSVNSLGEVLAPVHSQSGPNGTDSLTLVKFVPNGQILSEKNVTEVLDLHELIGNLTFPIANGGWIIAAGKYVQSNWQQHVIRVNAAGDVVWHKLLSFPLDLDFGQLTDGHELSDGSLVLYGFQQNEALLIKMGADGSIYPHMLVGRVARDSTFDCLVSPTDPPLKDWIVTAGKGGETRFANTDADGHYTITDLDTGSYQVKVIKKNYLWNTCIDSVSVTYTGATPLTDTVDFQIQPLYDCPVMQIDLATGLLRRCFPSTYSAQYCNTGNRSAESVTITIELDPLFQVDSASVPYVQSGNVCTFAIGTVAPDECGYLRLYGTLSCDAPLEQTLCAEAHITPDTICAANLPNWSGATVEVTAHCVGDSVQFSILNTGYGANAAALDFIVIDDHVITRQGKFNLNPGEAYSQTVPADGSTWRLVADQEPGFPFGQQMPSVAVEGCNSSGGSFTTGMVNLFANYSGDPFNDIDCRTVVGSFDPNDKQAFPIGVDNQHFIDQDQPIDYQIRFQNTGTDTAFTVVVKDTLAAWLDPATIRPGASSHPYTWAISGTGVLTVTFKNILLPDSNINEAASHGFVQFRIEQRPDNPLGALLENRAAIYFDFNASVMTNTVWHTIGHNFLPVPTTEPATAPALRVWPNPASQISTVWMDRSFEPGQQLVLRDAFGRIVQEMAVEGASVQLRRANLPAGLYFLELRNANGVLGLGKVVWE